MAADRRAAAPLTAPLHRAKPAFGAASPGQARPRGAPRHAAPAAVRGGNGALPTSCRSGHRPAPYHRWDAGRSGFSLIELLMVVMLLSTAILPIYSLIKTSQKRIVRADEKTLATLFGASALELARTLGFEKAQNLDREAEFQELRENARKNGFNLEFKPLMQPVGMLPGTRKQVWLLRIEITVSSIDRGITDSPTLTFFSILADPRFTFY